MKEFQWVEAADCLGFHDMLIARFGGLEGLRDEGLLESALARSLHLVNYGDPSIFDLAAAYAHGIVKNHPFLDGNQRSSLMAAAMFLEVNGWTFQAPEEQAVLQTLALAAGEIDADEFAAWLKATCVAT